MEYVEHIVKFTFKFSVTIKLLPKWLYHFAFPLAVYEIFSSTTALPILDMVSIFYFSHSSGCIVVSHCDFNLHFSNVKWSWGSYWKWMNPTFKMANNLSINLTRFLFWNYPFNLYYFSIYNHRPKSQNTKVTFLSSRWLSDFYVFTGFLLFTLNIYFPSTQQCLSPF